jgi:hypothetical protein
MIVDSWFSSPFAPLAFEKHDKEPLELPASPKDSGSPHALGKNRRVILNPPTFLQAADQHLSPGPTEAKLSRQRPLRQRHLRVQQVAPALIIETAEQEPQQVPTVVTRERRRPTVYETEHRAQNGI